MILQKSLAVLLVSLVVLSLAACGNKGKGSTGMSGGAITPLDIDAPITHNPEECPKFAGSYSRDQRRDRRTVGLSRRQPKGPIWVFSDGRVTWVVDGGRQQLSKRPYRAYCQKATLFIEYYHDGMCTERLKYFRDERGRLVIVRQPVGKGVAVNGKPVQGSTEIFDPEKRVSIR